MAAATPLRATDAPRRHDIIAAAMTAIGRAPRTPAAAALLAAAILTLALGFVARHRVLAQGSGLSSPINDFDRWLVLVPRFLHQHIDYVDDTFPTAPLTLLLIAPATLLGRAGAQVVWLLVKLPIA